MGGSPNPDYQKELKACEDTFHDMFALLGLDAGREQTQGFSAIGSKLTLQMMTLADALDLSPTIPNQVRKGRGLRLLATASSRDKEDTVTKLSLPVVNNSRP